MENADFIILMFFSKAIVQWKPIITFTNMHTYLFFEVFDLKQINVLMRGIIIWTPRRLIGNVELRGEHHLKFHMTNRIRDYIIKKP